MRQLNHELRVIEQAGLANYFLIVWDIVRFALQEGVRCQGRGSAANSLVAYLLYISPIDPIAHDLVFERFLSSERQVVPDIDIDFDAQRREEVIQYIYKRYGSDHTAMACTYVTFRTRSAIRDIGKALGLAPDVIATAVRALDDQQVIQSADLEDQTPLALLLNLSEQIEGFPAAPGDSLRRHDHHRCAFDGQGTDGTGDDARSGCRAMGQGSIGGHRAGQDRHPWFAHVVGH